MPVQFNIKVTKEILEKSRFCGFDKKGMQVNGENCAIALALNDLFPEAFVSEEYIYPFGKNSAMSSYHPIPLPKIAREFIKLFDSLCMIPKLRMLLPEFEFMIDISDEIISSINIEDLEKLTENALVLS